MLSLLATAGLPPSRSRPHPSSAVAQDGKRNIIVIMGDDVGWENIGSIIRA